MSALLAVCFEKALIERFFLFGGRHWKRADMGKSLDYFMSCFNVLFKGLSVKMFQQAVYAVSLSLLCSHMAFADYDGSVAQIEDEKNSIDIFQRASPAVVYVTNTAIRRDMFSLNTMEVPKGTGTGFIWDDSGLVVTNLHVIQGASKVTITLSDHSSWNAKLVGVAPDKDLAVLKISAPAGKLKVLPVGDSSLLKVGRKVLAIGNPFGLDATLTVGVVSALGREIESVTQRKIRDVIQTDAAINPGNSGGPLLNSAGQLIGVNTAIYSPDGGSVGIGFAIPVNTIKKIVPQLIKYGRIYRPVLGVETATDHWAQWNKIKGVVVLSTKKGLSAHKAGLQGISRNRYGELILGDVIVAMEEQSIANNDELLSVLETKQPGDVVTLTVVRKNQAVKVQLTLTAPK